MVCEGRQPTCRVQTLVWHICQVTLNTNRGKGKGKDVFQTLHDWNTILCVEKDQLNLLFVHSVGLQCNEFQEK